MHLSKPPVTGARASDWELVRLSDGVVVGGAAVNQQE